MCVPFVANLETESSLLSLPNDTRENPGGYDILLMWLFCRRWYYNRNQREEPVEDSSGHYVVRDGSLIIQGVQESDGGSYMCTASNSEGSESMEVRLTVSAPLNVHVQPSIQTVDLGKAAHLVIPLPLPPLYIYPHIYREKRISNVFRQPLTELRKERKKM